MRAWPLDVLLSLINTCSTDGVLRPVPMMVDGHFCPDEDLPSDPASFPMATQDVVRSRFSPEQRMLVREQSCAKTSLTPVCRSAKPRSR